MALHNVLVYGTLRTGKRPTVEVEATMANLGWYPGIKLGGDSKIVCERIEGVDDAKLAAFDNYECYSEDSPENSLYVRRRLDNGDWIYKYNGELNPANTIESGDWLEFTGEEAGSNAKLAEA